MNERESDLSVSRQCELLGLTRSSVCQLPQLRTTSL